MKCFDEIKHLLSDDMDYGVRCQNGNLQFIFFVNDWDSMADVIRKYGLKWAQKKYDWIIVYSQYSCECNKLMPMFFQKTYNGLIVYIENNSYIECDIIEEIQKMGYEFEMFQTHQGIGRLFFKKK